MKTAVVFGQGGAKGAFQVGVLQKLFADGLKPDVVYGTSTGALNACALSHVGIDGTAKIWLDIKSRADILSFNWGFLWKDGFYSTAPLKKILDKLFQNQPRFPYQACYVDLNDGSVNYGNDEKSVLASASIPFAMEPVDGHLVDGGVRNMVPLKKAIEDGADKIIVILCNPMTENPYGEWSPSWPYIVSKSLRALDIIEHQIFVNDISICRRVNEEVRNATAEVGKRLIELTVYAPDSPPMDTLDFDPAKIRTAMNLGYVACPKVRE